MDASVQVQDRPLKTESEARIASAASILAPSLDEVNAWVGGSPEGSWRSNPRELQRSVLVAVLNNREDFRRIADEGWYRIPQRRAPDRVGADYLAFYQTAAFSDEGEANTITWLAATRRYRLATRRELLPDESSHPRASDYYFRIDLGPLQRLQRPVPASTWRRLVFIHTTLGALLNAGDVKDLVLDVDPFDTLWRALRKNNLRPLRNRLVADQPVDITLKARGGTLGINCREMLEVQESSSVHLPERWQLITLSGVQIEQDLNGCLRQIGAALLSLGGSVLNPVS